MIGEAGVSIFESWSSNFWIVLVLKTAVVLMFFLVVPLGVGYMEHKVLAHMQARLGPTSTDRLRNDYLETAIAADLPVPPDRWRRNCISSPDRRHFHR